MRGPPTNFIEALRQIFFDPNLLPIYLTTLIIAFAFPFLITFCIRKWNAYKLRNLFASKKILILDEAQEVELPNGMIGSFNRKVLDCISQANSIENNNSTCHFITKKNLTLTKTKEENTFYTCKEREDEHIHKPTINKSEEPFLMTVKEKDQKRLKKKYKDPDPETAEALNKLIADGLHGKLVTAQLRAKTHILEEKMSQEERKNEAEIKQQQLSKIFELMEAQKEKFGINEKEELVEQMKLYSI